MLAPRAEPWRSLSAGFNQPGTAAVGKFEPRSPPDNPCWVRRRKGTRTPRAGRGSKISAEIGRGREGKEEGREFGVLRETSDQVRERIWPRAHCPTMKGCGFVVQARGSFFPCCPLPIFAPNPCEPPNQCGWVGRTACEPCAIGVDGLWYKEPFKKDRD